MIPTFFLYSLQTHVILGIHLSNLEILFSVNVFEGPRSETNEVGCGLIFNSRAHLLAAMPSKDSSDSGDKRNKVLLNFLNNLSHNRRWDLSLNERLSSLPRHLSGAS